MLRPSRLIEHLALMSFSMFPTNEVSRIVWFGLLDALGHDALSSSARWALWTVGFVGAFVGAAVFRYGFDRPVQTWLNPSPPRGRSGIRRRRRPRQGRQAPLCRPNTRVEPSLRISTVV
ncbi:hypothetical protein [Brevundimonas sp.]|uniref:hypothetical protein n=1 Tax=Brevundimonas sp. TaxID=1871086 RepID=UPI003F6FBF16